MPDHNAADRWGATLDGVRALLSYDNALPVERLPGQRAITAAAAEAWMDDAAAAIQADLAGWETLTPARQDAVAATGRDLTCQFTASYVERARFPERSYPGSYAQTLWERYTAGLKDLCARVIGWLAVEVTSDPTVTGAAALPYANFPAVQVPDGLRISGSGAF